MMRKYIIYILLAFVAASPRAAKSAEIELLYSDSISIMPKRPPVVRKDSVQIDANTPENLVIVKGDTVSMIIPEKNYGRYDRGLFNYLYIPKGHWAFGATASYGSLDTDNIQVLSMLKDINFSGKIYSIKPSISYFFKHNQSMGLRFDYSRAIADLGSLALDIDEDMNFNLRDVSYYSQGYKFAVFYRNYVGLNREKRFSIFNEVSLEFGSGSSRFKRYYNDILYDTNTITTSANINFSPGLCVFIQNNVAFNVSFGVFGLHFTKDNQKTNNIDEGSRFSSGANFKVNLFNINFGLLVVI